MAPLRSPSLPFSRQQAALCIVAMAWGTTFLIIHTAMRTCGPMFFVGLRFLIGAATTTLIFHPRLHRLTWRETGASVAIGLSIFLGYGLQTLGLRTIPSSLSAFITAFYVPLVPILQWFILRRRPGIATLLGSALAFLGLILVTGGSAHGLTPGFGETVSILGTLAIAAEILLLGRFAETVDSRRAAAVQLATASLLAFAAMPIVGESLPAPSWVWIAATGVLGLADAAIQLTLNWAQKSVSPARATLIYAGEPVWAGIFGRIAGERIAPGAMAGAALIVVATIIGTYTRTPRATDAPKELRIPLRGIRRKRGSD